MATASSNVQVKVEYKGTDNASKASKRATEGVRRFGRSAKQATKDAQGFGKAFEESGDRVSDTSGKASTALSSLGDFAGASEGAFRQASEAASKAFPNSQFALNTPFTGDSSNEEEMITVTQNGQTFKVPKSQVTL